MSEASTNTAPTKTSSQKGSTTKPTPPSGPTAASLLAPRHIPGFAPPSPDPPKTTTAKPPADKKKRRKGGKGGKDDASNADTDVASVDARAAALVEAAPLKADLAKELVATEEEVQAVNGELEEQVELEEWKVFKQESPAVEVISAKLKKLHTALNQAQETPSKNDGPAAKPKAEPKTVFESAPYLEHSIQELNDLKTTIIEDEKKRLEKQGATLKEHQLADHEKHETALHDAATTSKTHALAQVNTILDFLSLSALLSSSNPSRPFTVPIDDVERRSIAKANKILLEHPELRADVVDGLLNVENTGDVDGVPYARLRALTKHFSTPVSQLDSPETSMTASGLVYVNGHSNSVQFGSVKFGSGLDEVHGVGTEDGGVVPPGDNAEVVEGSSIPSAADIQNEWTHVKSADADSSGEGQELVIPENENPPLDSSRIDWAADDEDELPPIEGLHAKFGTSGQATPTSQPPQPETPPVLPPIDTSAPPEPAQPPPPAANQEEDNGWVTPHPGRRNRTVSTPVTESMPPPPTPGGRGGRGGRGDFRGSDRGYPRGGPGGFRGRGGSNFRGRGGAPGEVPQSPSTFGGGWRSTSGSSSPATAEGPGWSEGSGERGRGRGGFRGRGDRGDDWRGGNARRGGRGNYNSPPQPQQQ